MQITFLLIALCLASPAQAAEVIVEAESFEEHGGWLLDPQFQDVMGSPYLLAHGLGRPVVNAKTKVHFPETGKYSLWIRTKDWVPTHHPGQFQILLDGVPVPAIFGRSGQDWNWETGGQIEISKNDITLELKDLTGFDGRCDALFFTKNEDRAPPNSPDESLRCWRKKLLGIPETPPPAGEFDVVVVGGGIAGCAAALTAARLGIRVALIQNRPVLGGNASTEVNITPRGIGGPVIDELLKPGERSRTIHAEKTIKLYLGWHAFGVKKKYKTIESVLAKNNRSGRELYFEAPVFIDCTGDGSVGYLSGAGFRSGREARSEFNESLAPEKADRITHGHTVIFKTRMADRSMPFPKVEWAKEVSKDYANLEGWEHQWEYGQFLNTVQDAERIRDHLFRAIYGTFKTAKEEDPTGKTNLELAWVGHIAARGESRRLLGDYILTENDIRSNRKFPDGVAIGSLFFCLHSPSKTYDFRSDSKLIPVQPYLIPFRCLYSRNTENLMMAGRDISATHVAYTSIKLMQTGGQMGRAAGAAAFLCRKYGTTPRGIYRNHIQELQDIVLGRGEYRDALKR